MSEKIPLDLMVNGRVRELLVAPHTTLLSVLREQLALRGCKRGCNQGVCGACTVLLDGEPVRACLSLAANCENRDITTVEGLGNNGAPAAVQRAMVEANAVQCGFCTSGVLLSAKAFLDTNPSPSIDEVRTALSGNLCRCSGYKKIVDAVMLAASYGVDK